MMGTNLFTLYYTFVNKFLQYFLIVFQEHMGENQVEEGSYYGASYFLLFFKGVVILFSNVGGKCCGPCGKTMNYVCFLLFF